MLTHNSRFQLMIDLKGGGFKGYQPLGRVIQKQSNFLKWGWHLSSLWLHDERNDFIALETLSDNMQDLSPLEMSESNTLYFDMIFQVESGIWNRLFVLYKGNINFFKNLITVTL